MTRIRRLCGVGLLVAAILLGAAAVGAHRLGLDASTETLAPTSSASAGATSDLARSFGGDPVVVLVRAPWKVATDTNNIIVLAALEGQLMHVPGVKQVEGPGGLVYTAANAALDVALAALRADAKKAGDAARAVALQAGKSPTDADAAARTAEVDTLRRETATLLQTFPQIKALGVPGLDNPRFVNAFLFRPDGTPKPLYRQLFPRPGATLVVARLADGAGLTTVRRVSDTVSSVLAQHPLRGASVVVSGAPVVEEGLTRASVTDLRAVLPIAAVAMLALLVLLLPGWIALLPVVAAAVAVVYTLGALDLLRRPTTLAAIAALPILLGLVTDYVVQLVAGARGDDEGRRLTPAAIGGRMRALGLAAAATVAGALVLLLSQVPVVGSLGTVVALGVVCGLIALGLVAVPVLLLSGVGAARGARERLRTLAAAVGGFGIRHAAAVLGIAVVAGVAGLALSPLQRTTTDLRDFAASDLPALRDLDTLQRATGAGGEVDVLVQSSSNVAEPRVIGWMLGAERRLAALLQRDAPPPVSLADLLVAVNHGTAPDAQATNQILQTVPAYLLQGLVTPDATRATVTLGIPLLDLQQQGRLIERMRAALQPPPGVTARLAGAAVLAADGQRGLAETGLLVNLGALAAVALVLLAATRSGRRALVALAPVVIATGWMTLAVVALRVQVTPITAVLGALVVALATEFGVIWTTRFREARRAGLDAAEAAAVTSARTGSAIAVSGLTLGAGFLALAASSSPLLRGFGIVAGLGVLAAVAAVLLLCPPLCVRLLRAMPAPPPPVDVSPDAELAGTPAGEPVLTAPAAGMERDG